MINQFRLETQGVFPKKKARAFGAIVPSPEAREHKPMIARMIAPRPDLQGYCIIGLRFLPWEDVSNF